MAKDQAPKLGFIGLGNLGAPMAKRLVDWPGGLIVFDVRAEATTSFAEAGAQVADAVRDVDFQLALRSFIKIRASAGACNGSTPRSLDHCNVLTTRR